MAISLPASVLRIPLSEDELKKVQAAALVAKVSYALNAAYVDLLQKRILSTSRVAGGNKTNSYKRTLMSPLAEDVLAIIWSGSRFCPEEVCQRLNIERAFACDQVIRWRLAQSLEPDSTQVMKIRQRVDAVVEAAEAYGLVEKTTLRPKLKPIRASSRLHDFMLELGEQKLALMSELRVPLNEMAERSATTVQS